MRVVLCPQHVSPTAEDINPFAATLAAPSLQKTTNKSAKFEIIKAPSSPSRDHVKGFLSKFTVLKENFVEKHQIYCLRACVCALFSPEILQAGAVKGLSPSLYYHGSSLATNIV